MRVYLKCRSCGRVAFVDARARDWPACVCGDGDWRIDRVGEASGEYVSRDGDPDAWKGQYDSWKTGGGNPR